MARSTSHRGAPELVAPVGPLEGRALGATDPGRIPLWEAGEQLAVSGVAKLLGDRASGDLDDAISVRAPHEVRPHRLEVIARGLNEDHLGAVAADLLRLAAQAATGGATEEDSDGVAGVDRADRVQRGGRVEADDEVQAFVAQQVQIRDRIDAAVDEATIPDRHRVVD